MRSNVTEIGRTQQGCRAHDRAVFTSAAEPIDFGSRLRARTAIVDEPRLDVPRAVRLDAQDEAGAETAAREEMEDRREPSGAHEGLPAHCQGKG